MKSSASAAHSCACSRGGSKEQVQSLLTHSTEAMTNVYLDGHEVPRTEINTGSLASDRVKIGWE